MSELPWGPGLRGETGAMQDRPLPGELAFQHWDPMYTTPLGVSHPKWLGKDQLGLYHYIRTAGHHSCQNDCKKNHLGSLKLFKMMANHLCGSLESCLSLVKVPSAMQLSHAEVFGLDVQFLPSTAEPQMAAVWTIGGALRSRRLIRRGRGSSRSRPRRGRAVRNKIQKSLCLSFGWGFLHVVHVSNFNSWLLCLRHAADTAPCWVISWTSQGVFAEKIFASGTRDTLSAILLTPHITSS